jgi:hypothetical protein
MRKRKALNGVMLAAGAAVPGNCFEAEAEGNLYGTTTSDC